jgi:hypothetical protein
MNTTEPDQRDDTRGVSEGPCPDFNDNSMVRTTPNSKFVSLCCPSVNTECYHFGLLDAFESLSQTEKSS